MRSTIQLPRAASSLLGLASVRSSRSGLRSGLLSSTAISGLLATSSDAGRVVGSGSSTSFRPLHQLRTFAASASVAQAAQRERIVLAQELLHGVRPTSAFMRDHVKSLLDQGRTRDAIVEAYSAARALADVGKDNLLRLLAGAWEVPDRRDLEAAVLHLSELLLYFPLIEARPDRDRALDPMERLLTAEELHVVVRALALFNHHSRALMLFEHGLHRGLPLTRELAQDLLLALSKAAEAYRYSEDEMLVLFESAKQLLLSCSSSSSSSFAAPLKDDPELSIGLLRLFLKPHHLSIGQRIREIAVKVRMAERSKKEVQEELRAADMDAAAARGEDAVESANSNTTEEVDGNEHEGEGDDEESELLGFDPASSSLYQAALKTAETLRDRPDPMLAAATEFLKTLSPATLFEGGVLAEFVVLCLRRGKRDKALALLDALEAQPSYAVPSRCYNALVGADGSFWSYEAAALHLERMHKRGVKPGECLRQNVKGKRTRKRTKRCLC